MITDKVRCPCCKGAGVVDFTGVYADTLQFIIRDMKRESFTGAQLGRRLGVRATAMNNRLAILEEIGFLESRRYGRKRLHKLKDDA